MSEATFRSIQTAYLNCIARHAEAMKVRQEALYKLPALREQVKHDELAMKRIESVELINLAPDGKNKEERDAQVIKHMAGIIIFNEAQNRAWLSRRAIDHAEALVLDADATIRFEQSRIEYLTEALRFITNPMEANTWQAPPEPAKHPVRRTKLSS